MTDRHVERPRWAPRVPRYKIAQLYHSDARGIQDEDLVDEVGYALLARIEACLVVTEAHRGRVQCPRCRAIIHREVGRRKPASDEMLKCAGCGWQLPWSEYHKSYRKKHLGSAGLKTYFKDFAAQFPKARGYREKLVLIDTLLHRYHWELEGEPGGPGAVNLIGGTRNEVIAFLNELTYGERSTPGLKDTWRRWRKTLRYAGWTEENLDRLSRRYQWESLHKFEGGGSPNVSGPGKAVR